MFRILLISLCCLSTLWAHKLNLFAHDEEDGMLYLHSYFTKSSPCKNCTIKLLDKDENLLATQMTNEEGKASLSLPKKVAFIIVDGGMGHQERIVYQPTNKQQEERQESTSSQNELTKIALSLAIIILFFGGLYGFKKRKNRCL